MNHPETPTADSLLRRVLRETLTFGALQAGGQLFLFVSNILLARLLMPADFGIYDICGFFIGFGVLLGDGGLGAALLRKPSEPSEDEYASVLLANASVGALLTLGFALAAPLLAGAYHLQHSAVWVLIVMAPGYLISSLRSYPMIRLERELRFGIIARIELFVLIGKQAVAITLALLHFGVWALVLANIGSAALAVLLTFIISPGLPPLRFSKAAFKPLLVFGAKVQALTLIAFMKDNVANAMLGALTGPAAVGMFNFAVRYVQTPVLAVNALARIQLPTYARLQSDPNGLYNALKGALRISFLVGVPFLIVLATGASWLVPLIFQPKWLPSVPLVWALLPNMVGALAAGPLFTLLQAQNQAGRALVTFAIWTSATWLLSFLACTTGSSLVGVACAYSLVTVAIVIALLHLARHTFGRSLFPLVRWPVLSGGFAIAVCWLVAHSSSLHGALRPLVLLVLPLVSYVLAEALSEGRLVWAELRGLLRSRS